MSIKLMLQSSKCSQCGFNSFAVTINKMLLKHYQSTHPPNKKAPDKTDLLLFNVPNRGLSDTW